MSYSILNKNYFTKTNSVKLQWAPAIKSASSKGSLERNSFYMKYSFNVFVWCSVMAWHRNYRGLIKTQCENSIKEFMKATGSNERNTGGFAMVGSQLSLPLYTKHLFYTFFIFKKVARLTTSKPVVFICSGIPPLLDSVDIRLNCQFSCFLSMEWSYYFILAWGSWISRVSPEVGRCHLSYARHFPL